MRGGRRERWAVPAVVALLFLWALGPLAGLQVASWIHHQSFTGVDTPAAADGFQYLSWVREAGRHLLISDQFRLTTPPLWYLEPITAASGLLWRVGVPLVAAYLLWLPVAIALLAVAYWSYVRRLVPGRAGWRAAVMTIGLFFSSPSSPLMAWAHLGSPALRYAVGSLSGQMLPAASTLDVFPALIALGLMPVFFIGLAGLLDEAAPHRFRRSLSTVGAGALAAWLHPWQGEVLVLAGLLLVAISRAPVTGLGRARLRALCCLAIVAVPLAYYWALYRYDPAWRTAADQSELSRFGLLALIIAGLPLVAPALRAVPTFMRGTALARTTVVWPLSSIVIYLLIDRSGTQHSLEGISLPLAVLAVSAIRSLPAGAPSIVGAVVALLVIPGTVQAGWYLDQSYATSMQTYRLSSGERMVLAELATRPGGGVLADMRLSPLIPPLTGHPVWIGHPTWTPNFDRRLAVDSDIFEGRLPSAALVQAVEGTLARYVVEDCGDRLALHSLGVGVSVGHFGCVSLYQLPEHEISAGS